MDAHGHQVDTRHLALVYPACERAIATDGYCAEAKIGFVRGSAYFSRLTYLLALGKPLRDAEIQCPVCRRNAETHGWCGSCNVGMAGHIAIEDRQAFQEIEGALRVLEVADEAAKRCEQCAVAIVTDTHCPLCRIAYKDGKPAKDPGTR
jgi:RNA polymerase subunit RPABC4/transcription elongation factor Spt4